MADKIPVKAILTGADVTALGEYVSGDTIPVASGGTGSTGITGVVVGNGTAYSGYTTSGSGTVVALATSPSFTTPTLGVASATTVNKVTLTAPATGSTLTIADGKTLTTSNTLTFTGTDASSVAFGTGGTVIYSGGALGTPSSGTLSSCSGLPISSGVSGLGTNVATFLGSASSANLLAALTDKTGSGLAVFNTNPAITNPTVTNYVEAFYTITYASTFTLSLANGTMQTVTLAGSPTITMPTAVAGKSFTLIINTGIAGSYTVSWSTVAWAGGTTPTVTTTASKKDIFNFYSDGTLWYGSLFGASF